MFKVFLPQGFPESVSEDYVEYQLWDTLQALCSSVSGTLASQAVLKGVGVGDDTATVLGATFTWMLKDGAGMVGRILFAWIKGTQLDCNCKRWRLFADVTNDASMFVELVAAHFLPGLFTPLVCIAGVGRSLVGVAGGATRAALTMHQARRNNMADVSAKDGSQETLSNLIALLFNFIFVYAVTGSTMIIWLSFVLLTLGHLYCNYRAVKAVKMDTFNMARFHCVVQQWLQMSRSPGGIDKSRSCLSVAAGNANEPVIVAFSHNSIRLHLGVSLNWLLNRPDHNVDVSVLRFFGEENYAILMEVVDDLDRRHILKKKLLNVYVLLRESSTDLDQMKGVFHAEIIEFHLMESRKEHFTTTSQLIDYTLAECLRLFPYFQSNLSANGWRCSPVLFDADEWRYA